MVDKSVDDQHPPFVDYPAEDDLIADSEQITLPTWHMELVLKRKADFEQNPDSAIPLHKIKRKMMEQIASILVPK